MGGKVLCPVRSAWVLKCGVSSILNGLVSGDGEDTGKVEWNTRNGINGWSKLKSPQNGPTEAKHQLAEDDDSMRLRCDAGLYGATEVL